MLPAIVMAAALGLPARPAALPTVRRVSTGGFNAPEALLRVVSAGPIKDGRQVVTFQLGMCRTQSTPSLHGRVRDAVETTRALHAGELYLDVFLDAPTRGTAYVRPATSAERNAFDTCDFSHWPTWRPLQRHARNG